MPVDSAMAIWTFEKSGKIEFWLWCDQIFNWRERKQFCSLIRSSEKQKQITLETNYLIFEINEPQEKSLRT